VKVLFVHQNFPGQYVHLANHYGAQRAHEVVALGEAKNLGRPQARIRGVRLYGYAMPPLPAAKADGFDRSVHEAIHRGKHVAAAASRLRRAGFRPDVVFAHIGWGEALFLKDVFPEAQVVLYCEFFYRARGADFGFDPEFAPSAEKQLRLRVMNAPLLMSLAASDAGVAPTRWQRQQFPAPYRSGLAVLHDGIDTQRAFISPDPRAEELVTYFSRNLEPYRGFHSFMRAIPEIQRRRPRARILIVGGDEVSYSPRLPPGETYKARMLKELDGRIDMSRIEFRPRVPYAEYLSLLRRSSVHVYLTYPFVMSWSLLEAMASGCLVVGSRTPPVEEAIVDGQNGLLADFFSPQGIAERVDYALSNDHSHLRENARRSVVERYDLRTVCLPAQRRYVERLLASSLPVERMAQHDRLVAVGAG
jgi:glycosyltransferase involved in cell wall biosynthesis